VSEASAVSRVAAGVLIIHVVVQTEHRGRLVGLVAGVVRHTPITTTTISTTTTSSTSSG